MDAVKRRSGSETRQRTVALTLRLLPAEQQAIRILADRAGHRTLQAWIREAMEPHLDGVAQPN